MRSLSEGELRVIATLISGGFAADREAARMSGVPVRTFHSIRRRAFLSGWLKERFIPSPRALGIARIRFRLAQPFSDRRHDALEEFRSLNPVVLAASSETFFSVEFVRSSSSSREVPGLGPDFRRGWVIDADTSQREVVAYFDYEGIWSRLSGIGVVVAYPRGLSGGMAGPGRGGHLADRMLSGALKDLVLRPFEFGITAPARLSFSQTRLPRTQRVLLRSGLAFRRVIPDFLEMPLIHDHRIDSIIFVTGRLRSGRSGSALFEDLVRRARSTPFLFASDGDRVILASLGPAPQWSRTGHTPTLEVLADHLHDIEVVRDRLTSLYSFVDHRYDRCWTPGESGERG
jgi:hypothetical protein